MAYIVLMGPNGATYEQVSEACRMRYTTVSARISELKKKGLVEEAQGLFRKTTSGQWAAVLVATGINPAMPVGVERSKQKRSAANLNLFSAGEQTP